MMKKKVTRVCYTKNTIVVQVVLELQIAECCCKVFDMLALFLYSFHQIYCLPLLKTGFCAGWTFVLIWYGWFDALREILLTMFNLIFTTCSS